MSSDEEEGYSNPWNEYQHDHAGLGWSRSEMSENYQEYKTNGYESPTQEYERETYSNTHSYQRDSSPDDEKSYSNPWNQYQHDSAGQGWSRSEMSDHYQASKANGNQSSKSENERETYSSSYSYQRDPSPDDEKSYSNPWNQYRHDNAGQGWSRSKMSEHYQASKANGNQSSESENERGNYNNSYSYTHNNTKYSSLDDRKPYSNPWNRYQHQNAGRGWSRSETSRHYQNEQHQSSASAITPNSNNTNKRTVVHPPLAHNWLTNRAATKLTEDNHSKQSSRKFSSAQPSRSMPSNSRESFVYDYNNNILKINQTQAQSKDKNHPKLTWQQYQHLYQGQGKTSTQLSDMYHAFRTQEQTFKWQPNYQLEFNSNGQLRMNTSAGREAMKTGLFDEHGNLRHRQDQIPWPVFRSKMQQMNIDSKMASAIRNNYTGSDELNTGHLKTSTYRQHIPQHDVPQRHPRDADHILEPQICVPHLRQEQMDHHNFQIFIEELNSKSNIRSMGPIENRLVKRNANIGISINKPYLNVETLKQEKLQASQARLMAQQCEARGAKQAARILNNIAEKCTRLNSIHQALYEVKINTTRGKLTEQSDIKALIQQIITYERKYGTLEFLGGNVTQQHLEIFDQAHEQRNQQRK